MSEAATRSELETQRRELARLQSRLDDLVRENKADRRQLQGLESRLTTVERQRASDHQREESRWNFAWLLGSLLFATVMLLAVA